VREQIELPLRILLAFLVGVGLVFLLYYLDDSVRNEHELNAMGIQVIGVIPKEK
jgi:capsular polysaccharide biosynthesis protein